MRELSMTGLEKVAEEISSHIREEVTTRPGWEAEHRTVPSYNGMAGSVLLARYEHDEHTTKIDVYLNNSEVDIMFGVSYLVGGSVQTSHPTNSVSAASTIVNMMMDMHDTVRRTAGFNETEKDKKIEELNQRVDELETELEGYDNTNEMLSSRIEGLNEQLDYCQNLLSTFEKLSLYQDDSIEWYGIMRKDQNWRPPYHNELMDLAKYIETNWLGSEVDDNYVGSEEARDILSQSYIITLGGFKSPTPGYNPKMMFVLTGNAEQFHVFMWDDDGRMIELPQNKDAREQAMNNP